MTLDLAAADPAITARLRQFLVANGDQLGRRARRVALEYGEQAVLPLIALAVDPDLASKESYGAGYISIHAVELLGELADVRAIEPLLELLAECDPDEHLYSGNITALSQFGHPVIAPALAAAARFPELGPAVAEILCALGIRDERIFGFLCSRLAEDPELAAGALLEYGDPAALPSIYEALRKFLANPSETPLGIGGVHEFSEAIDELGGAVPEDLLEQVERQVARQDEIRREWLREAGLPDLSGKR